MPSSAYQRAEDDDDDVERSNFNSTFEIKKEIKRTIITTGWIKSETLFLVPSINKIQFKPKTFIINSFRRFSSRKVL